MRARRFPPAIVRRTVLALAVASSGAAAQPAEAPPPPWRQTMMPWYSIVGDPRPWRSDPKLKQHFHPQYPDDIRVLFRHPNADSARAGRNEVMWVTVIADDQRSGSYLGVVLNQPYFLKTVTAFDNVVFAFDSTLGLPAARDEGHGVAMAGWPRSAEPDSFARLVDGVRAYREGRNGHNMPGIERCIRVLTPLAANVPPRFRPDERFVTHFVLGRCLAEKYETERAVDAFKAAIAADSTSVDAHMALLAEYSILVHHRRGERTPADREKWERAFVDQAALIRTRFPQETRVQQVLGLIMQPPENVRTDTIPKDQLERAKRVGWATFRWKQR